MVKCFMGFTETCDQNVYFLTTEFIRYFYYGEIAIVQKDSEQFRFFFQFLRQSKEKCCYGWMDLEMDRWMVGCIDGSRDG